MRHINLLIIVAIGVTLPIVRGQGPELGRRTEKPKVKVLVKQLPAGVEGVELKDGVVRLKPGYKFVKKRAEKFFDEVVKDKVVSFDEFISVARVAGSPVPQAGGSWSCECGGGRGGSCSIDIDGMALVCRPAGENPCKGTCVLSVTVLGARTGVIMY